VPEKGRIRAKNKVGSAVNGFARGCGNGGNTALDRVAWVAPERRRVWRGADWGEPPRKDLGAASFSDKQRFRPVLRRFPMAPGPTMVTGEGSGSGETRGG
jgi:hypothetical protein